MAFRPAPLNSAFMLSSILGFLISVIYVWQISKPWAFTFALVFFIMFISGMIAMLNAPPEPQIGMRIKK